VAGQLEMISVHRTPTFNVYDTVTHKAVACGFDPARLDEIRAALGERVVVTGIVHRNTNGEPVRVEKPELRLLRADADLPTVRDLIGLAPDLTGFVSPDEYVRKLRNG